MIRRDSFVHVFLVEIPQALSHAPEKYVTLLYRALERCAGDAGIVNQAGDARMAGYASVAIPHFRPRNHQCAARSLRHARFMLGQKRPGRPALPHSI